MKKLSALIVSTCLLFSTLAPTVAYGNTRVNPEPRPPINQGIDISNPMVLAHTDIYNTLLSEITSLNTIMNPVITLNPYGTAPSSMYAGIYAEAGEEFVDILVHPLGRPLQSIGTIYPTIEGENLIPITGLVPDTENVVIIDNGTTSHNFIVKTDPLPASDSATVNGGFVIPEVTVEATDNSKMADGLYFVAHWDRNNIALDQLGNIRWYTTKDIPSFNLLRLSNGRFLSASEGHENFRSIFEFDLMGRVHKIYKTDNRVHHSMHELPGNRLMLPSEYSSGRPGELPEDNTVEDGLSIIDLSTGLEVEYYDLLEVLDFSRQPRPNETALVTAYDWVHLNQSYIDEESDIIVNSSRHQGAVFGIDNGTSNLRFILANHQDWDPSFEQYLLTPVDSAGTPLYDLTLPEDIDKADKEFWTWGQHNPIEIKNGDPNVVEFYVLDNGNYRSRTDENSLYPKNNFTRTVRFKINLTNMTAEKAYEYGAIEVGSRGYSSYVSSQNILENGNLLVNFGAVHVDENGQILTGSPGESDLADPTEGLLSMGQPFIQEIDPNTGELLFEMKFSSGYWKDSSYYPYQRFDVSCFRAYKMPLYAY